MNKKPVFDVVRAILGRGFTHAEVARIDAALDNMLGEGTPAAGRRLGVLSEQFESGGRGAGAVSTGIGDPGGVSYGIWQLSSRAGTVAAFVAAEGSAWKSDFGSARPGSGAFSAAWRAIAAREEQAFAAAQHAFIERTHYRPAIAAVMRATGCDLDLRHPAVRDAAWSVAVQHGGAGKILIDAVKRADVDEPRASGGYDRALVEAIYAARASYVLAVAARASSAAERRTLVSITERRYPAERSAALAMLEEFADA